MTFDLFFHWNTCNCLDVAFDRLQINYCHAFFRFGPIGAKTNVRHYYIQFRSPISNRTLSKGEMKLIDLISIY